MEVKLILRDVAEVLEGLMEPEGSRHQALGMGWDTEWHLWLETDVEPRDSVKRREYEVEIQVDFRVPESCSKLFEAPTEVGGLNHDLPRVGTSL